MASSFAHQSAGLSFIGSNQFLLISTLRARAGLSDRMKTANQVRNSGKTTDNLAATNTKVNQVVRASPVNNFKVDEKDLRTLGMGDTAAAVSRARRDCRFPGK